VSADIAYIGRHTDGGRVTVHIAGIHAIGSLGAAAHLAAHLPGLYAQTGDAPMWVFEMTRGRYTTRVRCVIIGMAA
jgi:hypothetical protein